METTTSSLGYENCATMTVDEMTDRLAQLEMQAELSGFSFAAHLIGVACAALKEETALCQRFPQT